MATKKRERDTEESSSLKTRWPLKMPDLHFHHSQIWKYHEVKHHEIPVNPFYLVSSSTTLIIQNRMAPTVGLTVFCLKLK